jgi:phosphatidate cytidylyltransferase
MPVRALAGAALACAGTAVTLGGVYLFAGAVVLVAFAVSREWQRLVGMRDFSREWAVTGLTVVAAVGATIALTGPLWPPAILLAGAGLTALLRGRFAAWSAFGVLYVGVPAWSLVALRVSSPHAGWIVLGILIVVWATDTGALLVGRAVGGPKLMPALSPQKTWAGFVGGTLVAGLAAAAYVECCGGSFLRALMLGGVLALAGHGGDLFESWVKRRFGRKNSGALIPGHGGVLDRLDSTLFAAPVAALIILPLGTARLLGVHA